MTAIHKEKTSLIVLAGNCVVNIVLNLVLIPKLSLYGAAISTVVSELFYFAGYFFIISRNFGIISLSSVLAKPILASLIMGIFLFYFDYNIFLSIPMGVLVYVLSMFLMKAADDEEIKMVKSVLKFGR